MNGQAATLERSPGREELAWTTRGLVRLAFLAMAAGLLVAALGPFGTYGSMSATTRLAFWETVLVTAAALHIPSLWLAERVGLASGVPAPGWVIGAALLAALPTTLVVTGVVAIFYGVHHPPNLLSMFGYVLTISLPMQFLSYATLRAASAHPFFSALTLEQPAVTGFGLDEVPPDPAKAEANADIWLRVPASIGTELACLEMQDHYVQVHTRQGSALILMRMSDAEREVNGIAGARVHRSWWVARNAIEAVKREGRAVRLELSNGLSVPVSRDRLAGLRAEGWV